MQLLYLININEELFLIINIDNLYKKLYIININGVNTIIVFN